MLGIEGIHFMHWQCENTFDTVQTACIETMMAELVSNSRRSISIHYRQPDRDQCVRPSYLTWSVVIEQARQIEQTDSDCSQSNKRYSETKSSPRHQNTVYFGSEASISCTDSVSTLSIQCKHYALKQSRLN
jgi:hypothetical protein